MRAGQYAYASGAALVITRDDVRRGIQRLVGVWPPLARRDALRQEIGESVMRHAERIDRVDIQHGLDDPIARARARQDDGGPAAPPGPHEVLGCILSAARARDLADITARDVSVTPEVEAIDARLRDDLAHGRGVTIDDVRRSNILRRYAPGLSFAEMWSALPEGERGQHKALRAMMHVRDGRRGDGDA